MKLIDNKLYFKYSELPPEQKRLYYVRIQSFLENLAYEYCGFQKWFSELFTLGAGLKLDREIIICECDFQLAGVAILKNNGIEKKICTLRVAKSFQRRGIGQQLMELSFEWLDDDMPLITIHNSKKYEFKSLFERYNFELEEKKWGYYHLFSTELVYNGALPNKECFINDIEMLDLHKEIKAFLFKREQSFKLYIELWLYRQQMRNYKKKDLVTIY